MADNFIRAENFKQLYANNVQFESSAWDLKLIFGLLDQREDPLIIRQHGSINLSWAQAKIVAYFLQLNILFHESQHGKIQLPAPVLPPPLDDDLMQRIAGEPNGAEVVERIRRLRGDL